MVRLLLLIFVSLLPSMACAATPKDWPYSCTADLQNGSSGGSATLIGVTKDGKGLVISCHHVFEDGVHKPTLKFPSGYKCRARVLGFDRRNDLSALSIKAPKDAYTPICVRPARKSDGYLTAVGYPFYCNGKPHWIKGKYIGYSGSDVHIRCFVHSGFSGGSLYADDGAFVGVVCGYGDDYSYAPSGPALVKFVSRFMEVEK
jgi:S1-C subfamily serine protease